MAKRLGSMSFNSPLLCRKIVQIPVASVEIQSARGRLCVHAKVQHYSARWRMSAESKIFHSVSPADHWHKNILMRLRKTIINEFLKVKDVASVELMKI